MPVSTDFRPTPNIPVALGHQYQKILRPELPVDLGNCTHNGFSLLEELGWGNFVRLKRGSRKFGSLNFNHPAKRLLKTTKFMVHRSSFGPIYVPWVVCDEPFIVVPTSRLKNTLTFSKRDM